MLSAPCPGLQEEKGGKVRERGEPSLILKAVANFAWGRGKGGGRRREKGEKGLVGGDCDRAPTVTFLLSVEKRGERLKASAA